MAKESAGLLLYRWRAGQREFLLVHPGSPFWQNKDAGAWTIPKGEVRSGEEPLTTAQREFEEELGFQPQGQFIALTPVKQKGGKVVHGWAFEGDCNPDTCKSNTFNMQWPPRSGRVQTFPEVDQVAFFDLETAKAKINPAQVAFLEELEGKLGVGRA